MYPILSVRWWLVLVAFAGGWCWWLVLEWYERKILLTSW